MKRTIKVSEELHKKLNLWKYELDCKDVEEVIDHILSIVPASKLKDLPK